MTSIEPLTASLDHRQVKAFDKASRVSKRSCETYKAACHAQWTAGLLRSESLGKYMPCNATVKDKKLRDQYWQFG